MASTAMFERQLAEVISFAHDCECLPCQERQAEERWRVAISWGLWPDDVQMAWLEAHPSTDILGAALRALLERVHEDGGDVAGRVAYIEEHHPPRWPRPAA